MHGQKLSDAKTAAKAIVSLLGDSDKLTLISFSSETTTHNVWNAANANARAEAEAYITALEAGGMTNLNDAFKDGIAAVASSDSSVPIVVCMSDGQASEGETDRQKIRENAKQANQNVGAAIFNIAFGAGADYALLLGISADSAGTAVIVHEGYGNADTQMSQFIAQAVGTVSLAAIRTSFCLNDAACTTSRRRLLDSSSPTNQKLLADTLVLQDSTALTFPVLEQGGELSVRGRAPASLMDSSQTLTATVRASSKTGAVAKSTSIALQRDQATLPSGSGARAFAHARILELSDTFIAQQSIGKTSEAQTARNAALALALANNILWPGLTSLVITKTCAAVTTVVTTVSKPTCKAADDNSEAEDEDADCGLECPDAGTTVGVTSSSTGGAGTFSNKTTSSSSGTLNGCFIATAAYGTEMHPNLQYLRQYRDLVLRKTKPGTAFVQWYYSWSPAWAKWLNTQPVLRTVVRATLWPVVVALQALRELDSSYTLAAAVTVCLGVLVLATSVRMAAHVILRVGGALFLSKSKAD